MNLYKNTSFSFLKNNYGGCIYCNYLTTDNVISKDSPLCVIVDKTFQLYKASILHIKTTQLKMAFNHERTSRLRRNSSNFSSPTFHTIQQQQ